MDILRAYGVAPARKDDEPVVKNDDDGDDECWTPRMGDRVRGRDDARQKWSRGWVTKVGQDGQVKVLIDGWKTAYVWEELELEIEEANFAVDEAVEVADGGRWYKAKIARINQDGTFDVDYKGSWRGQSEARVASDRILSDEYEMKGDFDDYHPDDAVEYRIPSTGEWVSAIVLVRCEDMEDDQFPSFTIQRVVGRDQVNKTSAGSLRYQAIENEDEEEDDDEEVTHPSSSRKRDRNESSSSTSSLTSSSVKRRREDDEQFQCPICCDLIDGVVEASCCGNLYCEKCATEAFRSTTTCPTCREDYDEELARHPSRRLPKAWTRSRWIQRQIDELRERKKSKTPHRVEEAVDEDTLRQQIELQNQVLRYQQQEAREEERQRQLWQRQRREEEEERERERRMRERRERERRQQRLIQNVIRTTSIQINGYGWILDA